MIYEIISKNDVPTSQMHIYLKNKTGDDGGIYPEIFNDLALSESVNGLYAFSIACVLTDNFKNTSKFLKNYPSKEVAVLALIQYIKGMATTVQLKNKCVNPLYDNLTDTNQLGSAPTLLNLDGDLFHKHYDNSKYFSREAADSAEDSFPYWVINTVKEITNATEIVTPVIKTFELPYYIQNISDENIPIVKKDNAIEIIGYLPATGIEPIIEIINGYGILGTSENACILLDNRIRAIKHVVELSEIDSDVGTLKLPKTEFDVICKCDIQASYGISKYYEKVEGCDYKEGDIIHIKGIFHNNGIIENGIYVKLNNDNFTIKMPSDHTNLEHNIENADNNIHSVAEVVTPFYDCKYIVIIPFTTEDLAYNAVLNILNKSEYKQAYLDVDASGKSTVVIYGNNDISNANKVKKKILAIFGYKATVVELDEFYK